MDAKRYILLLAWLIPLALAAQQFRVASFRVLPNDVTAFVTPVNDLNDDACALIKVECAPEFAFSTPLGIVRRDDKTGEVWLYVPHGTKKLTIKHPEWGVVRDYSFPSKLESHKSYELRIDHPSIEPPSHQLLSAVEAVHDTVVVTRTEVVTRTDTVVIAHKRERSPLNFGAALTLASDFSSGCAMPGLWLSLMRRHGAWLHVASGLKGLGSTVGDCDKDGELASGEKPYYSGSVAHSRAFVTAGAIHRLNPRLCIFEGIGWGYDRTAWELDPAEGGGWLRNRGLSHQGVAFELGARLNLSRCVTASLSVASIQCKKWYAGIGIGFTIEGRRRR